MFRKRLGTGCGGRGEQLQAVGTRLPKTGVKTKATWHTELTTVLLGEGYTESRTLGTFFAKEGTVN